MELKREFTGEFLGTFLLVTFGCGTVAVNILFNAHQGLFQTAMVWGIGLCIAIYLTRHLCFAHFNPAVSIAMVISRRMLAKKLPVYLIAQFIGAFTAGLLLYLLFSPSIAAYESIHHIVRGSADSMRVAMIFGEYYHVEGSSAMVSMPLAMCVEGFGTLLLTFMIFSLTEDCNVGRPDSAAQPLFIGLGLMLNICLLSPLTQAGFNPARDFGPRMVALLFGWGAAAFPDHTEGFFFVYILAPVIGAIVAGLLFTKVLANL